jgi:hypothetical protein
MVVTQIARSSGVSRTPIPPTVLNEADESDRCLTGSGGKLHQIVELRLGRRVENPVAAQGCEPVTLFPQGKHFVVRHEGYSWHHGDENGRHGREFKRN